MRFIRFVAPLMVFLAVAPLPLIAVLGGIAAARAFASPPTMAASVPLPLPHSITALAAIHRARIAIAHARQVCRQAIAAARRQESRQLKLAEKHAMHRNDLKDAVLISRWEAARQTLRRSVTFRVGNRCGTLTSLSALQRSNGIRVPAGWRVFSPATDPAPGRVKIVTIRWPGVTVSLPDPCVPGLSVHITSP